MVGVGVGWGIKGDGKPQGGWEGLRDKWIRRGHGASSLLPLPSNPASSEWSLQRWAFPDLS